MPSASTSSCGSAAALSVTIATVTSRSLRHTHSDARRAQQHQQSRAEQHETRRFEMTDDGPADRAHELSGNAGADRGRGETAADDDVERREREHAFVALEL